MLVSFWKAAFIDNFPKRCVLFTWVVGMSIKVLYFPIRWLRLTSRRTRRTSSGRVMDHCFQRRVPSQSQQASSCKQVFSLSLLHQSVHWRWKLVGDSWQLVLSMGLSYTIISVRRQSVPNGQWVKVSHVFWNHCFSVSCRFCLRNWHLSDLDRKVIALSLTQLFIHKMEFSTNGCYFSMCSSRPQTSACNKLHS